ncbi:MAG: uracil-DNA glycosylase [Acholeplasma sp.]|nr:uracil-DNA glycosylase [Acholeplasma sp.]
MDELIINEMKKQYFKDIITKVREERRKYVVYPNEDDVFKAFDFTPLQEIKVVILGQDPYHGENQAHGLAFSSLDSKTPKSLFNIKKELQDDLHIEVSKNNNDLSNWAKQGVFLLNTILTVRKRSPLSHANIGWQEFTLNVFKMICKIDRPIVFILWGNEARKYKQYVTNEKHLVIESSHPSPLSASRGFFGSKPFSRTNDYLISNDIEPIDFTI